MGIGSQVSLHRLEEANIQWDKLTDFSTISEELSKLKDLAGNPLLTSYANATEAGADMGAAGSLSYTSFINNSRAYLDKNAQVTILEGSNGGWEKTLPNESKLKWDAPLSIAALAKPPVFMLRELQFLSQRDWWGPGGGIGRWSLQPGESY